MILNFANAIYIFDTKDDTVCFLKTLAGAKFIAPSDTHDFDAMVDAYVEQWRMDFAIAIMDNVVVECCDFESCQNKYPDLPIVNFHKELSSMIRLKPNQQVLVDWYEKNKYDFDNNLIKLCDNVRNYIADPRRYLNENARNSLYEHLHKEPSGITTLVNMHQFGYEMEVPKYIIELPNTANYNGKVQRMCKGNGSYFACGEWQNHIHRFTEDEIKKNISWAWELAITE